MSLSSSFFFPEDSFQGASVVVDCCCNLLFFLLFLLLALDLATVEFPDDPILFVLDLRLDPPVVEFLAPPTRFLLLDILLPVVEFLAPPTRFLLRHDVLGGSVGSGGSGASVVVVSVFSGSPMATARLFLAKLKYTQFIKIFQLPNLNFNCCYF